MEENKSPSFVLVQCPRCKSQYRVDRSKIPDQGIAVRCKKCQTKLLLKNKIRTAVPSPEPPPPPDPESCPKCGFKQKQGEICYKCGAKIRNLKPSEKLPAEPISNKSETAPLCLLDLSLEYDKNLFFASMLKPVIEIDHEAFHRSWGTYQFQLPPGKYPIRIFCPLTYIPLFEQIMTLQTERNEYIKMQYKIHSLNHITLKPLIREPMASWRLLIKPSTTAQQRAFNLKEYYIILMVVIALPYGLHLLWKSDRFTEKQKWIIGILGLLVNLYFLSKIKLLRL